MRSISVLKKFELSPVVSEEFGCGWSPIVEMNNSAAISAGHRSSMRIVPMLFGCSTRMLDSDTMKSRRNL